MAQDAVPNITPAPEVKPRPSPFARLFVFWLRVAFASLAVAVIGVAWSFWLPYPWSGNVGVTAAFAGFATILAFIWSAIIWDRVPKYEEAWCLGLGFRNIPFTATEERQRDPWAA